MVANFRNHQFLRRNQPWPNRVKIRTPPPSGGNLGDRALAARSFLQMCLPGVTGDGAKSGSMGRAVPQRPTLRRPKLPSKKEPTQLCRLFSCSGHLIFHYYLFYIWNSWMLNRVVHDNVYLSILTIFVIPDLIGNP